MEIGDPTEYQFALRVFGSWDHWQALCSSKWFSELVTDWRAELKTKMESDRYWEMVNIRDKSAPDSAQAIQATKWLADRFGKKAIITRGRPSKEELKQALKHKTDEQLILAQDAKIVGIS